MRPTFSRTIHALPTLLRIGVAETLAYRAEFLVWMLISTQPLIMMSLWTSVARDEPFHGYTSDAFVAYFLAALIVRQLTSIWVAYQMVEEVRMGTMAMRLLRPLHPLVAYMSNHAAAIPFRTAVAVPVAVILLATSGASTLPHGPLQLAAMPLAILLAWLLAFAMQSAIGALAFFMTQATGVMYLYVGLYSVLSGYLLPLDLMPRVATIAAWLPFRYLLAVPVEIMTRPLDAEQLAGLLARQAVWVTIMFVVAVSVWKAGVRRFESVGG